MAGASRQGPVLLDGSELDRLGIGTGTMAEDAARRTHQVLAPGVIRENRYRVQAININGKTGPWSKVATLDPTELGDVWLQTPDDSTLWVRLKVRNPDGNALHVRYENTGPVRARDGNTGTGTVGYAEHRLAGISRMGAVRIGARARRGGAGS